MRDNEESIDNDDVVDYILSEQHIITIEENEEICVYKNGIYERGKETKIRKQIRDFCKSNNLKFSINRRNIILEIIKVDTFISINEFDKDPKILNFKNGLFDLSNYKFKNHTHTYLSFRQIPVKYDDNAKCSLIDNFISEVFGEEDVDLIYEIIGLCLTPNTKLQKAFLLYGEGNNGKTTFLNLLRIFIGHNSISSKSNVSSVDLSDLYKPFAMSDLEAKLINIVSDLDSSKKLSIRNFKLYVGDELSIRVAKKYKDAYSIKPTAKLLYSCNTTFPQIPNDTDKGFFRKWILLESPNCFDDIEDKNLLEKLSTQEELSGLLNIALKGLIKLDIRDGFDNKYNNWKEVKEIWMSKIDDFETFITESGTKGDYIDGNRDINNEFWALRKDVLKIFNKWRKDKLGKPFITLTKLTQMINSHPDYVATRRKVGTKRENIYSGFKIDEIKSEQVKYKTLVEVN